MRFPGNIGSTSPEEAILVPIIADPASPNPSANKAPILMIAFSIYVVSFYTPMVSIYISLAIYGFFAIKFTFVIILSMGANATLLASFEKAKAPKSKTALTKSVLTIPMIEFLVSTSVLSDTNNIIGSP